MGFGAFQVSRQRCNPVSDKFAKNHNPHVIGQQQHQANEPVNYNINQSI
jgi:hypothetical protein